jgi:hypothetical protein
MRSPHRIHDRRKSRSAFVSEGCGRTSPPKIRESDVEINIARLYDKSRPETAAFGRATCRSESSAG